MVKSQQRLSAPIVCSIEITGRCNMRCLHCFASSPLCDELPTNIVLDLVDQATNLGVFVLDVGGGEPFLHRGIMPILRKINESGLDLSLTSNGTLINKTIAFELGRIGVTDQIQISIYGMRTIHDKITGINGSFGDAERGLKNLIIAGLKPSVGTVVMNSNKHQVLDVIRHFHNLGVLNFHIMSLMPFGRGAYVFQSEQPTQREMMAMSKKLHDLKANTNDLEILTGNFSYRFQLEKVSKWLFPLVFGDQAGRLHILIAPDGSVYPSEEFRHREFLSGNIKEQKLDFIWKNSVIFDKIQSIVGGLNLKGKCKTCLDLKVCRGGSRGIAWQLEGDLRASDPLCPRVRA